MGKNFQNNNSNLPNKNTSITNNRKNFQNKYLKSTDKKSSNISVMYTFISN